MRYAEKQKTWDDNWNDVIRYEFFQNEKLKKYMCFPANGNILQFVNEYFIEDAGTDQLLKNEIVRVVHYDEQGVNTQNKNVFLKYKAFDIYVKKTYLNNATNDRLKSRAKLIAEELKNVLLKEQHLHCQHFDYVDEYDLWTKAVGYVRYHIVFSYKTTV